MKTIEWVFSGIGVLLVSWLATWLHRRSRPTEAKTAAPVSPSEDNSSKVTVSNSTVEGPIAGRDLKIETYIQTAVLPATGEYDEFHSLPNPSAILKELNQTSFYSRADVAKNYIGIRVCWRLSLSEVLFTSDGDAKLMLISLGDRTTEDTSVSATVRLSDYPVLRTLRGHELVEVTGEIAHVQGEGFVHLRDVRLRFLPLT